MTMRNLLLCLLALGLTTPAFAADKSNVAWVSSNHIQVVDLDDARVVGRIPLQEFIHDIEFSPDGNTAYVASSKGLRTADANALNFTQKVSSATTRGLSVSADGSRLIAIHRSPSEDALAARKAGLPLPPATLAVYATAGMTVEYSFAIDANSFDLALSPDGERIFVLVPQKGAVYEHTVNGKLVDTVQLVDQVAAGPHASMLSELAMSPDGSKLVVPVTNADTSYLAEIALNGADEKVIQQDLGHARRIQGLRWDEDGSGVYVTAINHMIKFDGRGLPVSWKAFPANYVDVQGLPGTDHAVVATPTFSKARKSGGLAVLDANGEVLRSVELPDMSPFVVAVRP